MPYENKLIYVIRLGFFCYGSLGVIFHVNERDLESGRISGNRISLLTGLDVYTLNNFGPKELRRVLNNMTKPT